MSYAELTLSGWWDLSDEDARRTAAAIARGVDARLVGVGSHAYAGRSGRVAFFERDGLRYALVPGGTVRLGFDADRFTAGDEWEHSCAAGATGLFRWGDEYPETGPYGELPLIREPNLFGLVIGDDPYRAEFTTDPVVLCGGDGGSALCGGYGSFLSWLTLAAAYRDPDLAEALHEGGLIGETPVRPVLAIP
ncbi:hypothetical protein [Micromonospora sp. RP3T]|uniref:hypothetical protein n=1 Tax=Micromonospora sp. RP3T TaxID=2135446 RepID=UPI003D75F6FF